MRNKHSLTLLLSLIFCFNSLFAQVDGVWNPSMGSWFNNGETYEINWSSTNVQSVKIEYSSNGGSSWNLIVNNVPSFDFFFNSYSWSIPQNLFTTTHSNSLVRVTASNGTSSATSDFFTLSNQSPFNISIPNTSTNWLIGTNVEIHISSTLPQVLDVYGIDVYIDDVYVDSYFANHSITQGSSSFSILLNPNFLNPTNNAKIRIFAGDFNNFYVVSSSLFSLSLPTNLLTAVNSPQNLSEWFVGDYLDISWFSFDINSVNIELSTNAGSSWQTIGTNVNSQNNGSNFYSYLIGNTGLTEGNIYNSKIRITNNSDVSNVVESEIFTINYPTQGVNEVLSPQAGAYWIVDNSYFIEWLNYGVDAVDIEYSTNGGASWETITENEPVFPNGYNGYFWENLPATINDIFPNSLIRVSDSQGSTFAISEVFTLSNQSLVKFISPISTTTWSIGHTVNVIFENSSGGDITLSYIDAFENGNLVQMNDIFQSYSPGIHSFQIFVDPQLYYPSDFYTLLLAFEDANFNFYYVYSDTFSVINGTPPSLSTNTNSLTFNSNAASSTFDIISNTSWTITSTESWITTLPTFGANNATISVSVQQNPNSTNRNGQLIVEGSGLTEIVNIVQNGNTVGIENLESKDIRVFPNPTKDWIQVTFSNEDLATVSVLDLSGRVLANYGNFSSNDMINLSHLVNGFYIIKIEINNTVSTYKISKL
jgi:hypothetical protein